MNKSRGRVRAGFRSTAVLMAFAFVAVLTGFGGSQPVLASVLPPEQSAFGLEPADSDLPDAEGRRYVSVADPFQGTTEADDCALVRGGELVKLFNTEADVCIRPVVVSGRTVVFEKGHENGLWDRYHEDKRLKALEIHAEVVEIRDAHGIAADRFNHLCAKAQFCRCKWGRFPEHQADRLDYHAEKGVAMVPQVTMVAISVWLFEN